MRAAILLLGFVSPLLLLELGGCSGGSGGGDGTAANGGSSANGGSGGGAANGGSGAINFADSGHGDAQLTADSSCASESVEADRLPVAIYIMQDKSGSMGNNNKWNDTKTALVQFANDPQSVGMKVALGYFPKSGGSCNGGGYSTPDVPIGPLPQNAGPIQTSLNNNNPSGNTPMEGGMRGMVQFCESYVASNPSEKCAGVLVTDGNPNGCDESTSTLTSIAAAAYNGTPSIPVFTLGMQGANFNLMDQIAQSGGTGQGFDISSGGAQTFLQALQQIAGQLLACEYAMPTSTKGKIDPNKVLVQYTSGTGTKSDLKLVTSASACGPGGGFYYDNPSAPTKLILCPATCDSVQNDDKGKVDILLGCAVDIPS